MGEEQSDRILKIQYTFFTHRWLPVSFLGLVISENRIGSDIKIRTSRLTSGDSDPVRLRWSSMCTKETNDDRTKFRCPASCGNHWPHQIWWLHSLPPPQVSFRAEVTTPSYQVYPMYSPCLHCLSAFEGLCRIVENMWALKAE